MYWSPAQMLAHTAVNGAATRTGDLFGSGTISGTEKDQRGAFIELTWVVQSPSRSATRRAPSSRTRRDLHLCFRSGPERSRIGFGEVRNRILPATGDAK